MGPKVVIVHFAPIEFYPPIQNLIRTLEQRKKAKVIIIATKPIAKVVRPFVVNIDRIKLFRIGKSSATLQPIVRYFNYVLFFASSLLIMIWYRPTRILYFETISSWPVYIYCRFFNTSCNVLIHYHEYTSPQEYDSGMVLTKYFHSLEKKHYNRALWVSHTNEFRMNMFLKDIQPISILNPQIVPNYPPRSWYMKPNRDLRIPIKIVYVGALSLSTMYTCEFANWVLAQQGKVQWDIFSVNCTADARDFLIDLNSDLITLKGGIDYADIPINLKHYDIGIVLYKGVLLNHIFSVSNKLFEYLALGLDVWFPIEIRGSLHLLNEQVSPKVIAVNFLDMMNYDVMRMAEKTKEHIKPAIFCEDAIEPLLTCIKL